MIVYEKDPLPLGDQGRLKGWFDTPDAQLFRECVTAKMNEHYFDAINCQQKSEEEGDKFDNQARAHLAEAKKVLTFLTILDHLASLM